MFLNQPRTSQYPSNQDKVLQQFYQQRKKRSRNSAKRHSLLQKNSSYFSNSNYINISQNLTHSTQNNQQPSSHYSSFNNTTNFTPSTNQHNINVNTQSKTAVATRNHIKQRSISITQAQILKKYQDVNNHVSMGKSTNGYSLGTTAPATPTVHANRTKPNNNANQHTNLFSKEKPIHNSTNIKQPTISNTTNKNKNATHVPTNSISNIGQFKNNERRKNLQKLQNNFKILTGQLPAYHGEYYDNLGKNKSQINKNEQGLKNSTTKYQYNSISASITRSNGNITKKQKIQNLQINPCTNMKASQASTPKNSRLKECILGNENITVINKIRSNKKPELSSTPPPYPKTIPNANANAHTKGKQPKIDNKSQNTTQLHPNLINIKQYLANNGSFCIKQQDSSFKLEQYQQQKNLINNENKYDQDQPLLVLAANPKKQKSQQKHKQHKDVDRDSTLNQIYQKYNIKHNNSNKTPSLPTNEHEQQFSEYQDHNNQILIQQESCQNSREISPEQVSHEQEYQSPNFKMYVDNKNKNKVNNNQSGLYPLTDKQLSKEISQQKQNIGKITLLKNYDNINKISNKNRNQISTIKYLNGGSLHNSRASKASNGKKNLCNIQQGKIITQQTEQKIKKNIQASEQNNIQIEKEKVSKQCLNQFYQAQILKLQEKVNQLQKNNKKQKKFIDSVYSMRRTIDKVEDDCNLKDLWRWLKNLPNKL